MKPLFSTRQLLKQIALDERSSVQALITEVISALRIGRGYDPPTGQA